MRLIVFQQFDRILDIESKAVEKHQFSDRQGDRFGCAILVEQGGDLRDGTGATAGQFGFQATQSEVIATVSRLLECFPQFHLLDEKCPWHGGIGFDRKRNPAQFAQIAGTQNVIAQGPIGFVGLRCPLQRHALLAGATRGKAIRMDACEDFSIGLLKRVPVDRELRGKAEKFEM